VVCPGAGARRAGVGLLPSQRPGGRAGGLARADTALRGELVFSLRMVAEGPRWGRRGADVSGAGTPSSGSAVRDARRAAERAGVTINAIAIESMGLAISNFYQGAVITRDGFVMTARTHREYPEAIRRKIIRELSQILG